MIEFVELVCFKVIDFAVEIPFHLLAGIGGSGEGRD